MPEPDFPRPSKWSALRIISWAFVACILLVVALMGGAIYAVLQPSVQEKILRRQLERSGARDIQLAGIKITPSEFHAEHLAFAQGALRLDAHHLDLKIQPRPLFDHIVHIEDLSGQNVDISYDVSAALSPPPAAAGKAAPPAAKSPFPLDLPWKVIIGKFDVGGKFSAHRGLTRLEAGGWHLSGGGFAPGTTGTVRYELRPDPPAAVKGSGGTLSGTVEIPESGAGQLTGAKVDLALEAVPLAWANLVANAKGIQLLDGQLSGKIRLSTDAAGTVVLPGTAFQVAHLKVEKINSAVQVNRPEGSSLGIELLRPYRVDPANPLAQIIAGGDADWAHLSIGNVPLEAAAPWLPGRQIAGTWVQGDALVHYQTGKGYTLSAGAPWQFLDVGYAEGGEELFHGSMTIKPTMFYSADTQWVRFTDLTASDTRGYKVAAHGGIVLKGNSDQMAGGITLQATLPFFPGLPEKTGPYGVALSATARILPGGKYTLSKLTASLTGKASEMLAAIAADQPVTIEQTPASEWLVSSSQPLRVKTGAFPLTSLESFFAARGLKASGTIPATEFALWFSPRHFRLEPKTPIAVQRFHLERDNEVLIDRALLKMTPSLNLDFEHHLLPSFAVKATTSLAVKSGLIMVDGNRVGRFDLQVDLAGTEKTVAPTNLQGGLWLDLGALSKTGLFSHARLPAQGEYRLEFGKSTTDPKFVEFQGGLARIVGRDGKIAPTVEFLGRAQGNFAQKAGGFGVRVTIMPAPTKAAPKPRPTEVHFGFKVDFQHLSIFGISSHLDSDYVNLDDVHALESAFSPAVAEAAPAAKGPDSLAARPEVALHPLSPEVAPWGIVRGHFTLGIKELAMPPYAIKNLHGSLELGANDVALTGLSGEILGGKWSADFTAGIQPGNSAAPYALKAHFEMNQIDAAQAVHLRYPDPPAGIDGKLNLDVHVKGEGKTWEDLAAATTGDFVMTATGGKMRLVLPKKDMISNALIIGGTFTFSKELRALGRFVKTLEELPVNQIRATGTLAKDGKLQIQTVTLDSPQLRLTAVGEVANAKTRDLMGEPLQVNASLSASGDIAIMLSGMNLLEKNDSGGFRKMKESFLIDGNLGQPNLQPLYDMLARAVDNSHGTWGMLMRKVQSMVPKAQPAKSSL